MGNHLYNPLQLIYIYFIRISLISDTKTPLKKVDALFLKTHGWLLKLVALELHVTTQQKQRSNQLRLVKLLFHRTAAAGNALVSTLINFNSNK